MLEAKPFEVDLGNLETNIVKEFSVLIENTGTTDIRVDYISAGCGCTTPTLQKREYKPGETGTIEARFDTTNKLPVPLQPV